MPVAVVTTTQPDHSPCPSSCRAETFRPFLGPEGLGLPFGLQFPAFTPVHGISPQCTRFHISAHPLPSGGNVQPSKIGSNLVHSGGMLEHCGFQLAKVGVEGSNPFARSSFFKGTEQLSWPVRIRA